jgi:serine/threonine protein kinase
VKGGSDSELNEGKVVQHRKENPYTLLNIVGHGGMGVVFKAEDTKLCRTVALKFLPKEIGLDPEAKKRFLREAQAAAILDHPNICPVYEVDESEGEMFLTMAFVEGRSLTAFVHVYCEMMVPALARDPRFGAILDRLQLNVNEC